MTQKAKLFSAESVAKKQTLLQKAINSSMASKSKFDFSEEELELIQAWLNQEIGFRQVMSATGLGNGKTYTFLAVGARHLWSLNK